jgi:hypothetical protein
MSAAADQISATSTTASAKACGAFRGRLWDCPSSRRSLCSCETPRVDLSVTPAALVASVLDLLLDHFPDLVFDLLLIGRTHRVEPILGEAELGEHLDSCIGI